MKGRSSKNESLIGSCIEIIITEAFHALSKIFGREEFTIYTKERAEILLNKVKNTFNQIEPNQNYFPN